MPYAVQLYFEPAVESTIVQLWEALKVAGVSDRMINGLYRPHFTLTVGEVNNIELLQARLEVYAATTGTFAIRFGYLGIFPNPSNGVVYIGITTSRHLLELHIHLLELFEPLFVSQWPYYAVDNWVPHVTLGFRLSQDELGPVADTARRFVIDHPLMGITASVEAIGVVEVPGAAEVCTFDLGQ